MFGVERDGTAARRMAQKFERVSRMRHQLGGDVHGGIASEGNRECRQKGNWGGNSGGKSQGNSGEENWC